MFHKCTGHIAAIATSICLSLMAATSYAAEPMAPPTQEQTQPVTSSMMVESKASSIKEMSLIDLRNETKAKMSETREWIKDTKIEQNFDYIISDLNETTDKLQNKVSPARPHLVAFLQDKLPGKNLVAAGEKNVTIYGIILILAFAFVVFLMTISGPASRLGGRH